MDKKAAQLQARLKWEVACERLVIALNPPQGSTADAVYDLPAALAHAHAVLEEIRQAYDVGDAGATEPPRAAG